MNPPWALVRFVFDTVERFAADSDFGADMSYSDGNGDGLVAGECPVLAAYVMRGQIVSLNCSVDGIDCLFGSGVENLATVTLLGLLGHCQLAVFEKSCSVKQLRLLLMSSLC